MADTETAADLAFESPPVEEVAATIQFNPLHSSPVILALFWQCIFEDYPIGEERPYQAASREMLDRGTEAPRADVFSRQACPERRLFWKSADRAAIVQLQRDMIGVNWVRTSDAAKYPRYPVLRQRLLRKSDLFRAFLGEHDIAKPSSLHRSNLRM